MPRILVVDDERELNDLIRDELRADGHEVHQAFDGRSAVSAVEQRGPDLVVLDVMLPDLDGHTVCRRIRERHATPIIMLTARGREIDRVLGLEVGADDYVTKPFSTRELRARVRSVLRRVELESQRYQSAQGVVTTGPLTLDPEQHRARLDGEPLRLTRSEFRLLYLLAGSPGRVFNRDYLLDSLGDGMPDSMDRAIDTHVARLRRKLGPLGSRIVTVWGVGYRFEEGGVNDERPLPRWARALGVALGIVTVLAAATSVRQGASAVGGVWATLTSTHRVEVTGAPVVSIAADLTDVRVEAGSNAAVTVRDDLVLNAFGRALAGWAERRLALDVSRTARGVRIAEPDTALPSAVANEVHRSVVVRVPRQASVTVATQGTIRVGGIVGDLDLRSAGSDVEVGLPGDESARLQAIATGGDIVVDPRWSVTAIGSGSAQAAIGTLGGGRRLVTVSAANGTIRVSGPS